MRLAERRPIKRHALEAFDYVRLFDGRAWRITPADYGDRTPAQAYNLIRQAAWRRGLKAAIEFDGLDLIIQTDNPRK